MEKYVVDYFDIDDDKVKMEDDSTQTDAMEIGTWNLSSGNSAAEYVDAVGQEIKCHDVGTQTNKEPQKTGSSEETLEKMETMMGKMEK